MKARRYSNKDYKLYNAQAWPNDDRIDAVVLARSSDEAFNSFKDAYGIAPEYLCPIHDYNESEYLIVNGDTEDYKDE